MDISWPTAIKESDIKSGLQNKIQVKVKKSHPDMINSLAD